MDSFPSNVAGKMLKRKMRDGYTPVLRKKK
jgi:hypothetical protein